LADQDDLSMATDPGFADRAFTRTVDAFSRVSAQHPVSGGQLAIRSRDGLLVSVCAGRAGTGPWSRRTTTNVWSTSKAVVAIALSSALGERGHSLQTPLADIWPELRAAGDLPIAALLGHRLGLVGLRRPLITGDLLDGPGLAQELSETEPWWEPGTSFGYHSWTYGVLVNELCRRLDVELDAVVGSLCVAEPGATVGFTGRPADVAEALRVPAARSAASRALAARTAPETEAALRNPVLTPSDTSAPWWDQLDLPGVKCFANADGVSLVVGQLLGGTTVSAADAAAHLTGQGRGNDRVLGDDREFTAGLVAGHSDSGCPYSTDGRLRFGHDGLGGSFTCVDTESGLVLAWVTNGMGSDINTDQRKLEILRAFDDDTS
jgi:hypothetical protein